MPITLDELANIYQIHTGKKARIRPIEEVIDWAVSRKDLFYVDKDDNICLREKQMNWDEKKDKSGRIVKFDEEKFVNDWWNNLLPRQRTGIYRSIQYEDPIDAWRKE